MWSGRYVLLLLLLGAIAACGRAGTAAPTPTPSAPVPEMETLFPRNAIKALDHPPALPAVQWRGQIAPTELVMGLTINGESRAYPIGMLMRHEVANDTLGGEPIAITFCPLCNSGIAVSRRVVPEGGAPRTVTFEVSGRALDNAMVLVDRESDTLWAQSRLVALEGPLAGTRLELLPASQMSWEQWHATHPETTLASRIEARARDPGLLPSTSAEPAPLNAYVAGFEHNLVWRAYPLPLLDRGALVHDTLDDLPILIVPLGAPGELAAYSRRVGNETLEFERHNEFLVDTRSETRWDPRTGEALEGPLAGHHLDAIGFSIAHWLAWADTFPATELWEG